MATDIKEEDEIDEGEDQGEGQDNPEGPEEVAEGQEKEGEELPLCEPCSGSRIEIAKSKGKFFWMLYSKNGRMIATNPVEFTRLNDLKKAIQSVKDVIDEAEIVRLY